MITDSAFLCFSCKKVAEQAVEIECCGTILCEAHSSQFKQCPECLNPNPVIKPSTVIRKMIGQLNTVCPSCQKDFCRADLFQHQQQCEGREYSCHIDTCKFTGKRKDFLSHLTTEHSLAIIQMFDKNVVQFLTKNQDIEKLNQKMENLKFKSAINPNVQVSIQVNPKEVDNTDRLAWQKNSRGFLAKFGSQGNFYCGQPQNFNCGCCDGNCGPTNGCQCASCLQLTIKTRQLPKGYLINCKGATCKKGTTGLYYCGRYVMENALNCEGHCGPTNGPQCEDCAKLQRLVAKGYYNHILI